MDFSQGLERFPLSCISSRATEVQPFTYVTSNTVPYDEQALLLRDVQGCTCSGIATSCAIGQCPCGLLPNGQRLYLNDGRLQALQAQDEVLYPVVECGPACTCPLTCPNRVTQRGLAVPLQLRHSKKGWGVFTASALLAGQFVAQYAGELLSNQAANARLAAYDVERPPQGHALLVVRELLPSRTASLRLNIDATCKGNVARFFNHSCNGGNLEAVVVRKQGWAMPHVALFVTKDTDAGAELTFCYGAPNSGSPDLHHVPCACGSEACLGYMPTNLA